MKRLAMMTLLCALTACTGCESTPETPTKLPPIPAPEAPETKPAEPAAKFAVGDEVIVLNGDGTTIDGVIVAVGPMALWVNTDTKEQTASRVYLVQVSIAGEIARGRVPEFAMTRKRAINEKK